uniref:Stabilizer of axonemal microtubules 2 n=1 Tax=Mesocestoides corti TaxID=53468 RepID=A0A5K3EVL8_MESCO
MFKHKCICKICQCGRHKCPHIHPKQNTDPFCSATEYTDRYIGHTSQKQQPFKLESNVVSSTEPLSSETTHRADYIPLPLEIRKPKSAGPPHIPEGRFEGQSVYSSEFTEKEAERVEPIKPKPREKSLCTFDGEATYTADYKDWDVEPHRSCGPKYEYRKPSAEFKGEPIYTTDYIDHGVVKPPDACKPLIQTIHSGPFDAISTFTADYVPKKGDKQKPFRPSYTPVHTETPFSQDTTHRTDYTEWPLPEHFHRALDEYKPSDAKFDGRTTYRTNYTALEGERAKMIRPISQTPDHSGEFSDQTNYKKEYRRWSLKGRQMPVRGPAKYLPPEVPFDGQSIYQAEFLPKQLDCCPVLLLETNSNFVCEGEDENGHQFYSTRNSKKKTKAMVTAT